MERLYTLNIYLIVLAFSLIVLHMNSVSVLTIHSYRSKASIGDWSLAVNPASFKFISSTRLECSFLGVHFTPSADSTCS